MEIGKNITIHNEELGKGGFGTISRCTDENNNKFVVKICEFNNKVGLPPPMELSIMANYNHPYLNKSLKVHVAEKRLYIFQETAFSDLSKLVRKDKIENTTYKPTNSELRKWISSVASGLSFLHSERIVHADIKASNILIFEENKNKVAKLADFTVSLKLSDKNRKFTHTVCTSTHRPIENLQKKEWDLSLDIWCFGVTIYEIVYGCLLFPYQGNLGKRKNDSGKKVKDHTDERCINCLVDWADNGPRKQHHNYPSTTHKFHKFNLVAEFYDDKFKINDILLRMLSLDPKNRPTIQEINRHPFFSGLAEVEFGIYNLRKHIADISEGRRRKISIECKKYKLPEIVQENIMALYGSFDNGKQSRKLKLQACMLICCKLYKLEFPANSMEFDPDRLIEMERNICSNIDYKLHI